MRCVALVVVLSLVAAVVVAQVDQTVVPGAKGPAVVETVCSRITAACIFLEDKLLLRRIALVETNDGNEPIATGYNGGIWKVDKAMFDEMTAAQSSLQTQITKMKDSFGIDWVTVVWDDLVKPLHSALAARLYIELKSKPMVIPRSLDLQATFWKTYYRPAGVVADFIEKAKVTTYGCESYNGADIIFVLDASGSIQKDNFVLIKNFVKDFINSTNVGTGDEHSRIGVIKYSEVVTTVFDLSLSDKAAMIKKVEDMTYDAKGTNTHLGIDQMTNVAFLTASGARPKEQGHPRVGIVVTDGASNQPTLTTEAAKRAHDADITSLAVGVTSGIKIDELYRIASDPVCVHTILLQTFTEFDSLKYIIDELTCAAPLVVSPKSEVNISGTLPPGGDQNVQVMIPEQGTTMQLEVTIGVAIFYTSTTTYPSEAFYDKKVEASVGKPGLIYFPATSDNTTSPVVRRRRAATTKDDGTVFGNIQGGKTETKYTIRSYVGDQTDKLNGASANFAQGSLMFLWILLSSMYFALL